MALIKCKECGREISDTAKICVHCGAKTEKAKAKSKKIIITTIIIIIIFFLIILLISKIKDFLFTYKYFKIRGII